MLIKRCSAFTGVVRVLEIPVTQEQLDAWQNGVLVQHAMPNLTADQREFVISGVTPEEWAEVLGA